MSTVGMAVGYTFTAFALGLAGYGAKLIRDNSKLSKDLITSKIPPAHIPAMEGVLESIERQAYAFLIVSVVLGVMGLVSTLAEDKGDKTSGACPSCVDPAPLATRNAELLNLVNELKSHDERVTFRPLCVDKEKFRCDHQYVLDEDNTKYKMRRSESTVCSRVCTVELPQYARVAASSPASNSSR